MIKNPITMIKNLLKRNHAPNTDTPVEDVEEVVEDFPDSSIVNDDLKIYRGHPYIVNDFIKILQPTLDEICTFGEMKYFSLVHSLVATSTDMKYQLSLAGIDWNDFTDYQLFLMQYSIFSKDRTKILFGDLDLSKFEIFVNKENGETFLFDIDSQCKIDRSVYEIIAQYLRKAHRITRHEERAMTETTKQVLLEEAKENFEAAQRTKDGKSTLKTLISTMINMPGFHYNHETVWNMKINAFMDSVTRLQHIKNADLLLQSGYSGFGVDLSKIANKNETLNYFSESSK